MSKKHPRSSRLRFRGFVDDYKQRRLDEALEAEANHKPAPSEVNGEEPSPEIKRVKRRQYLREYLRWLWPYRYAVLAVFVLALIAAGLQMIEPLFMRFIVDAVLLP